MRDTGVLKGSVAMTAPQVQAATLQRKIDWTGAFWVASGVPALVLFSVGAVAATVGLADPARRHPALGARDLDPGGRVADSTRTDRDRSDPDRRHHAIAFPADHSARARRSGSRDRRAMVCGGLDADGRGTVHRGVV